MLKGCRFTKEVLLGSAHFQIKEASLLFCTVELDGTLFVSLTKEKVFRKVFKKPYIFNWKVTVVGFYKEPFDIPLWGQIKESFRLLNAKGSWQNLKEL